MKLLYTEETKALNYEWKFYTDGLKVYRNVLFNGTCTQIDEYTFTEFVDTYGAGSVHTNAKAHVIAYLLERGLMAFL